MGKYTVLPYIYDNNATNAVRSICTDFTVGIYRYRRVLTYFRKHTDGNESLKVALSIAPLALRRWQNQFRQEL